ANAVPAVRAGAAGQITGIGIKYPAPRGAHPLTGRRVPDVALAEGRLYAILRAGEFVLISPRGESGGKGESPDGTVQTHWSSGRRTTVLVRPDGYVAWAAEGWQPG
ncbi:FAD-dependent oxidoreductase, partial [Streptomyces sp. SID10116]|nr:FAD-dependent oxidoreductase [Streptomyces sp. SID10116]